MAIAISRALRSTNLSNASDVVPPISRKSHKWDLATLPVTPASIGSLLPSSLLLLLLCGVKLAMQFTRAQSLTPFAPRGITWCASISPATLGSGSLSASQSVPPRATTSANTAASRARSPRPLSTSRSIKSSCPSPSPPPTVPAIVFASPSTKLMLALACRIARVFVDRTKAPCETACQNHLRSSARSRRFDALFFFSSAALSNATAIGMIINRCGMREPWTTPHSSRRNSIVATKASMASAHRGL